MIVLYIILTIILDLFLTYRVCLLLWRLGYNKRAFLSLNIVGLPALISGIILLPYTSLFGYLIGWGVFNGLWSLWFLDWKVLPYNILGMWFNEHESLSSFTNQVKLEKPAFILHYAYHSVTPYAYVIKIENDTITIRRDTRNDEVELSFKDFYQELANYRVTLGGVFAKI